jgi:hypothetical protein
MLDTFYNIYKFVTDVPDMINTGMAIGFFVLPIAAAGQVFEWRESKALAWVVAILTFSAFAVACYFLFKWVGYPAWMGWIL